MALTPCTKTAAASYRSITLQHVRIPIQPLFTSSLIPFPLGVGFGHTQAALLFTMQSKGWQLWAAGRVAVDWTNLQTYAGGWHVMSCLLGGHEPLLLSRCLGNVGAQPVQTLVQALS